VQECECPELLLQQKWATIRTDADGKEITFSYRRPVYSMDGPDRVSVELGKAQPYGKTASKTALTFRLVSADEIALVQARRSVAFYRCPPPRQ
jgi:hypothetical protein